MTAVLREEPAAINLEEAAIPSGYQDIVRHCLEKDPENRFQSAKDLAFALQTLSGSSSGRPLLVDSAEKRGHSCIAVVAVAGLAVATALLAATQLLACSGRTSVLPPPNVRGGHGLFGALRSDGQSIVYSAAWNGKPVQLFSTVGNSLLAQPLNLSDANLLAISRSNELAVVLHGTHNGQLETVDGMLASAPLAGGSPQELLADVRWADWDARGKLSGRALRRWPQPTGISHRQGALSEQLDGSATFVFLPKATRSRSWIILLSGTIAEPSAWSILQDVSRL